jgi:hypothetical protein
VCRYLASRWAGVRLLSGSARCCRKVGEQLGTEVMFTFIAGIVVWDMCVNLRFVWGCMHPTSE